MIDSYNRRCGPLLVLLSTLLWLPVFGSPAAAQTSSSGTDWGGWGVRFGVADDPDQAVIGGLYDFGEFGDGFHIEADVDLGVGSNHTTLVTTGAFQYRFSSTGQVRPYVGGGPTFGFINHDRPKGGSDTDFEIGLKALGGVRWPLRSSNEFFVQLELGFSDLHDALLLAGWRF